MRQVTTGVSLYGNNLNVAAINADVGDWCLALKRYEGSLFSNARKCFRNGQKIDPTTVTLNIGPG